MAINSNLMAAPLTVVVDSSEHNGVGAAGQQSTFATMPVCPSITSELPSDARSARRRKDVTLGLCHFRSVFPRVILALKGGTMRLTNMACKHSDNFKRDAGGQLVGYGVTCSVSTSPRGENFLREIGAIPRHLVFIFLRVCQSTRIGIIAMKYMDL